MGRVLPLVNRASALALVKTIFISSLFTIFLLLFGLPSLKQYLDGGILVSVADKRLDTVAAPTITVCPLHPVTRPRTETRTF